MNLNIEYEGKQLSFPVKEEWDCMTLIERILNHLHLYIYAVHAVTIATDTEDIITPGEESMPWHQIPDLKNVTLITVNPRLRDEEDKVLPSPFVDSFIAYQQQRDDERIAREMQEVDYGMRRRHPEQQRDPAQNAFGQMIMERFLDAIDREIEARIDEQNPEQNPEEGPEQNPEEGPGPRHLIMNLMGAPVGAPQGVGNIFQRIMQTMHPPIAQEDVKVVCTDEELAECPRVLYGTLEDKKGSACNVCLEDFEDDVEVLVLPECQHYYHPDCITHWLMKNSNKCPVCRVSRGTGVPLNTTEQAPLQQRSLSFYEQPPMGVQLPPTGSIMGPVNVTHPFSFGGPHAFTHPHEPVAIQEIESSSDDLDLPDLTDSHVDESSSSDDDVDFGSLDDLD